MNRVALIVINWNGTKDTAKCVDSLALSSSNNDVIIIVDNGSNKNEYRQLEKFIKNKERIFLIRNTYNRGFAGGVNSGIRWAMDNNFRFISLINNDAIVDRFWLTNLVKKIRGNTSIVTGLLLNHGGKEIDSTSEQYSIWGMPFPRNRGEARNMATKSGYVFGATGGASLYRTSLFKEIGLFDESFFAYYEDVDISFRAQLAGHKVYYTDKAIAYHKQGASSKKIPGFTVYQTFKNIPLLFIKNVPANLLIPIGIRLLLLYVLIFANAVKNGTGWYALKGWLANIWYFWTRAIWLRFNIQRHRKVPVSYIKSILYHDLPPNQTGMRRFRQFFTGKP